MTEEVFNPQLQPSLKAISEKIIATNQISRSDLRTLVFSIRSCQELLPEDTQNIRRIIKGLQSGKFKILN